MVCMCLRQATAGLHTRVWLRDFSTTWDIGTGPLVCVQLIVYNKVMRAWWPFGARESFLQAGQGPILRNTKRIQLTLDSSRLLGATWVKEIGNVSYILCIFRLEVHIGISITSIKTASDRPENGVFIAELIPNSVSHNAGLKVKTLLTLW